MCIRKRPRCCKGSSSEEKWREQVTEGGPEKNVESSGAIASFNPSTNEWFVAVKEKGHGGLGEDVRREGWVKKPGIREGSNRTSLFTNLHRKGLETQTSLERKRNTRSWRTLGNIPCSSL